MTSKGNAGTKLPAPSSSGSGRRSPCSDGHSYKSEGARDSSHTAISGVSSQGFRIGDRIFVGGTRSGTICFIGHTKFAEGEWAGINLDDATGKNDGSVGGVRYFQCPMSHGLFSRLTNLSFERRVNPTDVASKPGQQSQKQQPKSASKSGSVSSVTPKTESQQPAAVTEASAAATVAPSAEDCPLKVGMRVIVGGTRPGTLRFVGTAGFAKGKGLFAGVELDEPTGKNDGSVEGERYFTCKPRYGLFAPVHRVLPLHADEAPGGGPNSGIAAPSAASVGSGAGRNRYGSQESVSSAGSVSRQQPRTRLGVTSLGNSHGPGSTMSAAAVSSAMTGSRHGSVSSPTETLKKVVQEKSEHIEQLLREREQERSEVARALAAAEEAEIARLKAERALSELRERLDSQDAALATSERERDELREKLEDLQFSMAESMIGEEEDNKLGGEGAAGASAASSGPAGDGLAMKPEAASASELSSLLERVSSLETRLAEREAENSKIREDAELEKQAAADEAASKLAAAEAAAAEQLAKLRSESDEAKHQMEKRLEEAGRAADEAKQRITELTSQLESVQASSTSLAAENERLSSDLMQAEASAAAARSETAAAVAQVDELRSQCSDLQASLQQARARISELLDAAASAPPPPPPPPPEQHQLQQQLEFLNSVIVDLKAKNTKLERDLYLLTALPDSSDTPSGGVQHQSYSAQPPRLYCDICEEFDQHDTEDCPVQGGSSESPRPSTRRLADASGGAGSNGGASRPYCHICEIFGHNTVDCNQDETY
ncbi:hypothetical protein BOX15_Mlig022873g2 [Macrostomum lignano]|uniref:CAP-Gly domain-containing protein n=1 Tax=Macrostomum lignano TaxID=282301 RepID=A0A267FQB0_9PLAT|nr:hypothetical protein BOX15_Mlig022873g2 [Macrostomum lignano]